MAEKATPAVAGSSAAPITDARFVQSKPRLEGTETFPTVTYKGDAPRKGSTLRLALDGYTYEGKVHEVRDADGEMHVETDGLTSLGLTE